VKLLLIVILAFAAIPAAIYIFTVITSETGESKTAVKFGLEHYGVLIKLAIIAAAITLIAFQCY
jgi:hypothetical protein